MTAVTLLYDRRFLVATSLAAIIAGGVLITLSRGAFLGLLAGSCLVALLVSLRGYRGALSLAIAVAVASVAIRG